MSETTLDTVRQCAQAALNLDPQIAAGLGPDARVGILPGWDSLGHVRLMIELERAFALEFDDEEVLEMISIAAILKAVDKKRG